MSLSEIKNQLSARQLSRRSFVAAAGATCALFAAGLAGCNQKKTEAPAEKPAAAGADAKAAKSENQVDMVVVGSGGAGMAAAIAAFDKGVKKIVILEKMGVYGGNTNFSSSGMNASETKFQKDQGIEDSNKLFADETFKGGHDTGQRNLVDFMCNNSAGAIEWLDGLQIRLDNLTQTGGMSVKRCHRPTDGSAVGGVLVAGLAKQVKERGIELITDINAKELMVKDGTVTGVTCDKGGSEVVYKAPVTLLATGGLGANSQMVEKYRPDLKGYVTTNQAGTTGDGYVMGEKAGAELIQMDQIQIHPTVEQSTSSLIAEGLRGGGAILVNKDAKRFFDELSTRDKVSAAELEQPGGFAWLIFDQQVYDNNKAAAKYNDKGIVTVGESLADLASKIELDPAVLADTVAAYNALTTSGAADEFGRKQGMIAFADGKYYAIKVAPGVHHCMGGIRIDEKKHALSADKKPVRGLYAAGEVTGGIHGNNRIGGNAVCDIIVNGKHVGEVIAEEIGSLRA